MNRVVREEVEVTADALRLPAFLSLPPAARGIVLFAHGSGSSRFSTRNQQVANALNGKGFATLLLDLLSPEEHEADQLTRQYRFDIPLLAGRLVHATDYVRDDVNLRNLPAGFFGASTGAAAALIAAAERPDGIHAVVSRGGRPDLAGDALPNVRAPVLLIVGGLDAMVIDLNRHAATRLNVEHRTVIVPGASHLFEEAGKLEEVERLAADWFGQWLGGKA
ncbi:MAG TPA: dienelactone hydrolase family protein [Gammaproteobacteria bacterium]